MRTKKPVESLWSTVWRSGVTVLLAAVFMVGWCIAKLITAPSVLFNAYEKKLPPRRC